MTIFILVLLFTISVLKDVKRSRDGKKKWGGGADAGEEGGADEGEVEEQHRATPLAQLLPGGPGTAARNSLLREEEEGLGSEAKGRMV